MSVVTFPFFIFVGIVFAGYWLCAPKWRWMVLLFASAYYMWCGGQYSVMLCGIFAAETLFTWFAALRLKKPAQERRKAWLAGAVITLLAVVLVLYKDIAFFVNNFNVLGHMAGKGALFQMPGWAAPFGISYYTLVLIGYLLDVYWGTVGEPQKNPLKMLLFAGYFPHLMSGPFTRYQDIAGTLFGEVSWSLRRTQFGLQRMLWGLFKKLVVAERLSVMVHTIYDSKPPLLEENPYVGLVVVMGAFIYTAYLYMDFSGCMDIVIGVSELFGIPLAENFCRPFSAASVSEFWRRWHMTLGFWVKDYVLYPVLKSGWCGRIREFCKKHWGRKAARTVPTYLGMFITWFCVGFWHGGTWKYICGSGLFFFGIIAGGMALEPLFQKVVLVLKINTKAWSWTLFQRVRTLCLFAAAVSFGRYRSLMDGMRAWKSVVTDWNPWVLFDDTIFRLGLERKDFDVCVAGILAVLAVSMLQERYGSVREFVSRQNLIFRWGVYLGLFFAVLILGCYGPGYDPADFIYGGF